MLFVHQVHQSGSSLSASLARAPFRPLPFDREAARAFGRVAASLRGTGRKVRTRAYEAMTAATALAHELPVFTCNPEDFEGITGLEVRAVPHPDISSQLPRNSG